MEYIIDDELLKIQIASMIGDYRGYAIEQDIINNEVDKIILKSLKPVEKIAGGEQEKVKKDFTYWITFKNSFKELEVYVKEIGKD
uniref:Uncharacterized protein n=1 Tax=viral metagenome TaxID=1070528 RepID=A0A6H1ZC12_9ZZZZ